MFDGPRPGGPSPDSARPAYAHSKSTRCYSEGLYQAPFGVVRPPLRLLFGRSTDAANRLTDAVDRNVQESLEAFEDFWPTRWAWDALDFYYV